jgi:hypothetical protein
VRKVKDDHRPKVDAVPVGSPDAVHHPRFLLTFVVNILRTLYGVCRAGLRVLELSCHSKDNITSHEAFPSSFQDYSPVALQGRERGEGLSMLQFGQRLVGERLMYY